MFFIIRAGLLILHSLVFTTSLCVIFLHLKLVSSCLFCAHYDNTFLGVIPLNHVDFLKYVHTLLLSGQFLSKYT